MNPTSNTTYEIRVLGCKVNQYDAQQLRRTLEEAGLSPAERGQAADVAIVHSCAVTANAMRKSLQLCRKLKKGNPAGCVLLTGCAAAVPDLDIPEGIHTAIAPHPSWLTHVLQSLHMLPLELDDFQMPGRADEWTIEAFAGHTRAFLKIQDGCNIGCSYCIVPSLRKGPRDKDMELIVQEACALAEAGHREIVVSGVSVGLYGGRGDGPALAEVMRRLVELPETNRLRLSSLHPAELTDELLEVWASSPKMLPHVHLPLQSGSNRILDVMRRGYSREEFLSAVDRARTVLDNPAFTTDVIVGFPGETDDDFKDTMTLSEEVGFSRMHIFPYSPRPGTPAATMPDQLNGTAKNERVRQLQALGRRCAASYHRQFVGKTVRVLVETWNESDGLCEGYSERYVPLRFAGEQDLVGSVKSVRVEQANSEGAWGKLLCT